MDFLLGLLSIIAGVIGWGIFAVAQGAPHEIEALIVWLIAAVFFTGACIVASVNSVRTEIKKRAIGGAQQKFPSTAMDGPTQPLDEHRKKAPVPTGIGWSP